MAYKKSMKTISELNSRWWWKWLIVLWVFLTFYYTVPATIETAFYHSVYSKSQRDMIKKDALDFYSQTREPCSPMKISTMPDIPWTYTKWNCEQIDTLKRIVSEYANHFDYTEALLILRVYWKWQYFTWYDARELDSDGWKEVLLVFSTCIGVSILIALIIRKLLFRVALWKFNPPVWEKITDETNADN